jgi:glucose-6-phosphate 1-dehydrogenase
MVVFGASGDLTRRKLMPALFRLECGGGLHDSFRVVGFARSDRTDDAFRRDILGAIRQSGNETASAELRERFASRLHYLSGTYDDAGSLRRLRAKLTELTGASGAPHELYYLALPPSAAETVLRCMRDTGFVPTAGGRALARIMIEKPFGRDLESARRLNGLMAGLFDESRVYRIDHYLAKDSVRNLLVLRFANSIFEPLWDRKYVDCIQITAAEEIGVEGRGGYYEEAGVVRDMVQNHVMQVLALVAMEAPLAGDAESVRDRKVEVFKSVRPPAPGEFVFGQYRGYREEGHVEPESVTPTFVALRMMIDNWRWQGVPFYIRSGKALARKVTEVIVRFREVPLCVVGDEDACENVRPNALVARIQPDEGVRLSFSARLPGRRERVSQAHMDFRYSDFDTPLSGGYEQVLLDGIEGKPSLFWRADGIEASWRAVAPLLDAEAKTHPAGLPNYEPGSWGPDEAEALLSRDGREWLPSY